MGRKRRGGFASVKRVEPHWAPVARQPLSKVQDAAIVARHAVPLGAVLLFEGSALQFCLVAVFGLAFDIAGIAVVGMAVSTRPLRAASGRADAVASWSMLALVGIVVSLVLTALFGWVIAVVAAQGIADAWNANLAWGVLATVAGGLPGLWFRYRDDLRAGLAEEQRKRRDQPLVFTHVLCAALVFLISAHAAGWGQAGAIALAVAITALFVFRDLRPDLARKLARPTGSMR
jgi:hypothetical protein